jgi:hypothetical protein
LYPLCHFGAPFIGLKLDRLIDGAVYGMFDHSQWFTICE